MSGASLAHSAINTTQVIAETIQLGRYGSFHASPKKTDISFGFAKSAPLAKSATSDDLRPIEQGGALQIVLKAAAVASALKSVERDWDEDSLEAPGAIQNSAVRVAALQIARRMAAMFAHDAKIDIVGCLEDDGRLTIFSHSRTTGRRVTATIAGNGTRVIQTGVRDRPRVFGAVADSEVLDSLCAWINEP